MAVKLDDMMERLPLDRRTKVEARAAELIAEEMSLRDLRKAMRKTQVAVAKKLGMKQESVSRIEQRADLLLSTLDGYLKNLVNANRRVLCDTLRVGLVHRIYRREKLTDMSHPSDWPTRCMPES
jgi:DNA-binding XRE family transcriptional regulator